MGVPAGRSLQSLCLMPLNEGASDVESKAHSNFLGRSCVSFPHALNLSSAVCILVIARFASSHHDGDSSMNQEAGPCPLTVIRAYLDSSRSHRYSPLCVVFKPAYQQINNGVVPHIVLLPNRVL